MNKNDTERISGLLLSLGMSSVDTPEEANLILLNTCSIRDKAERRVVGQFNQFNHLKNKQGSSVEFAVTGCMPQHAKEFIVKELPFLSYVVGSNNIEDLREYLSGSVPPPLELQLSRLKESRRADDVNRYEKELFFQNRAEGRSAWVSIMFGCDKFCSYCIVPYTRGREISRRKEDIFNEIESLREQEYKRIVLLGQNVNSYGKKIYKDYFFPELLDDIAAKFTWLEQIDFMTSHPDDVSESLIDVIAKHSSIHNEIHFPLQHGDNEILKRMNRKYTVEEYIEKVDAIRSKIPDVKIGTDLIVGFPGETEEQFNTLLQKVEEIRFDFANTAAYSIRPGTKAGDFNEQIDEETKLKRLNKLNSLLAKIIPAKKKNILENA